VSPQGRFGNKDRAGLDSGAQSSATLDVQDGDTFEILEVVTIGRAPDCNVVLNERSVSRHHARIFYESGHYWLKDLDSANGTKLNGKKISFQMLSDNDKIVFGEAKAVFHTSGEITGPAPLGSDPLEGSLFPSQDGTPTGGFKRKPAAESRGWTKQPPAGGQDPTRRHFSGTEASGESMSSSATAAASTNLEQENERLRKLVKQLERALADANVRLRNLQELLDRK
jgi:pSer/pThr/pTyr-binding forkhead associated (FHA) protein